MGTTEIRSAISEYVRTADEKVLRIVKAVFETYEDDDNESTASVSEDFENLIQKGLEDVSKGNTQPHKAVMEEIRKKYNFSR